MQRIGFSVLDSEELCDMRYLALQAGIEYVKQEQANDEIKEKVNVRLLCVSVVKH